MVEILSAPESTRAKPIDKRIIFVMVDGFGVHPDGFENSAYARHCSTRFISLLKRWSVPLDATLGVAGIPQSGTGQTTLFSGINAAKRLNAHAQAFPGPSLRKILQERNIFKSLRAEEKSVAFANAYVHHTAAELKRMKTFSVTSVITENAIGSFRDGDDLRAGNAVYHDITRHTLADVDIPIIPPEQAADDLLRISRDAHFTLFEHFLTDVGGHKRKRGLLAQTLKNLDRFVLRLVDELDDATLILSSDHGNCEDASTPNHTLNPVPLLIVGARRPERIEAKSIADVHDLVVQMATSP